MSAEKRKKIHYGIVVVIGMFLLQFPASLILSAASIFYTPVTEELGISLSAYGLTVTILLLAEVVLLPFITKICNKWDMRVVLTLSLVLEAACFAVRAMATGIWAFYITAVLLSIPFAVFLNMAIPIIVNNWFATNTGFMIGLCAASQGIGGMLFNSIGGVIIQNYGWRPCFWMYVVVSVVLIPVSLFVIRTRPSDKGLQPYGYEKLKDEDKKEVVAATGVTLKKALRMPGFWLIVIAVPVSCLICQINYYINSYTQSLGLNAAVAGAITAVLQLGVLIFKFALGAVSDRSMKAGAWFYCLCTVAAFLLLAMGGANTVAIVAAVFLYGNIYAATNLYGPLIVKDICGSRSFANIWSIIVMIVCLLSGFGATFWGVLIEQIGYHTAFVACIVLSIVLLILYLLAFSQKKKMRAAWTTEEEDMQAQ